jgi:hypothetical protein
MINREATDWPVIEARLRAIGLEPDHVVDKINDICSKHLLEGEQVLKLLERRHALRTEPVRLEPPPAPRPPLPQIS